MTQRRFRLSALLGLLALSPGALAAQKQYEITALEVKVAVQPDGEYRVSERIAYEFRGGTFHFAYRDLSRRENRGLEIDSVTAAGRRLSKVKLSRENGNERIRWEFPPTEGPAEFTVFYRVRGNLYEGAGRNIVDWDAVGRDWSVPISNLSVTVLLPSAWVSSADSIRAPMGFVSRAPDGWRVDYRYDRLAPRTPFRAIVDFPRVLPGRAAGERHLAGPPPPRPPAPPLPAAFAWELPLLGLGGLIPGLWLYVLWRAPKREASAGGSPPTDLPRAATILPETSGVPSRVFAAVLLDLAARGHVELRRSYKGRGLFKVPKVEVVQREVAGDELTPFEQRLLAEIARHGSLTDFGMKAGSFRRRELKALRQEALAEGLLENHGGRAGLTLALALLTELGGWALIAISPATRQPGYPLLPWGVMLVALGIGLFFPAVLFRTPTESGAELRARVLAYLASLRHEVGRLIDTSPVEAARAYIRYLPWLTLDARIGARWVQHLGKALKTADGDLPTPGWAVDLTGKQVSGSAAYVAFMPYYHVTTAAAGAVSPGAGGAGASGGAGAGSSGGGGGGGGGGAG